MTRKSRVFRPVEALEPKVLLSAVRAASLPSAGLAPVIARPLTTAGPAAATATSVFVPSAAVGNLLATPGAVTTVSTPATSGPIVHGFVGSYGHAGRSLTVNATGSFEPLGQVRVKGSITLSGPKSAQNVNGLLTLSGSQGSVTIQVQDSHAWRVIGHGPVIVTETVVGATGNGAAVQGETGGGSLELGHWVGTIHGDQGTTTPAHGSFRLVVDVIPPTG